MEQAINSVIVGRRRQGKSTLAMWLARRKRFIIVFDPNAQFRMDHDAIVVYGVKDFVVWLGAALDGEAPGIVVFRPDPENIEAEFRGFCDALWPLGNYAIILDEASCVQRFSSVHPKLERIVRQAPREGSCSVSLIQTSHRMVDYHGVCRSLASDFFLFQTTLVRDLDLIEEQFGPDVRREVQTLKQFELIHCWTGDDGQSHWMKWSDPKVWYVELSHVSVTSNAPGSGSGEWIGSGDCRSAVTSAGGPA